MRLLSQHLVRSYICPSCRASIQKSTRRVFSTTPIARASPDIYDVVCVGGGPAGLALAAALLSSPVTSNLRIALIESQDLNKSRIWNLPPGEFSNRCSSLTPTSVSFLQKIGAWKHVDASRVQPYQEMQVWDGQTGSKISFDWSVDTSPFEDIRSIATMTENANLVRGLLLRIQELEDGNSNGNGSLSVFSNTMVSSIENGSKSTDGPNLSAWPIVSLAPSPSSSSSVSGPITARLLVGADGINSPVRSFADITTSGWDYDRHGIVATLSLSEDSPSPLNIRTAYQRFLPSLGGPIALLPLPGNKATLVWSTKIENAAYLKSLPEEAFIAMINAAFRLSMTDLNYMLAIDPKETNQHQDELTWRLNHTPQSTYLPPLVTSIQRGTTASFPLRFRHASSYISPRVALIGDAAHVIHPLAGQGLNLGIGDVASLSNTIEYAVNHGMDIGDHLALEPYMTARYAANTKIGGMCDLLHKVYNVPGNGPVAVARSLGLNLVDRVPWLKGFVMKQAD
ncbi:ubiquinone biosynthesis monooxgenase (Coq6), putative [Talaromyces stipitatus ATCC 10500]|uniref:Ubiquinone biosynthesis monooxygenase COQ6, mitochondrial n=1 Tax=Talaromyces stipitatus (strain ATCC 10500 / CBS 375.48 / QM 6759 / NRRL 1006) TaxID=441959 RepID=B8LXN4_TALSN|nr:ubiquinone biosynthesis monooxgenase (Coq6), putative [Talaromyces stipitatus ATCC 10500]EED24535.1 ubiquinone biosynthesis monooxgenase (Coq6), putative [Talaromyces stipitatus ATCC 10500]